MWKRILLLYDLLLSVGAMYTGVLMMQSNQGIFTEYPKEWILSTPFSNWIIPGIIVFMVFGLGNLIAGIVLQRGNAVISACMGMAQLLSIIFLTIVLGQWFLATLEVIICSLIQLILCIINHKAKYSLYSRWMITNEQKSIG